MLQADLNWEHRVSSASASRPIAKDIATSERLGRVRQHGTDAELLVRAMVTSLGQRYRTNGSRLPGRPDLANKKRKWAIFVHGCFWHHHQRCPRATIPKNNTSFWREKFENNRARDAKNLADLAHQGFRVLVVWECDASRAEQLERLLRSFFASRSLPTNGRAI